MKNNIDQYDSVKPQSFLFNTLEPINNIFPLFTLKLKLFLLEFHISSFLLYFIQINMILDLKLISTCIRLQCSYFRNALVFLSKSFRYFWSQLAILSSFLQQFNYWFLFLIQLFLFYEFFQYYLFIIL